MTLAATARAETPDERAARIYQSIRWQDGPCTVNLGTIAELEVPRGYRFTDREGARLWDELNQNPPDEQSVGVLVPDEVRWALSFSYSDIGYVPDDEKDNLDADALLRSLQQGTEQGNVYRRQHGWSELHIVGWEHKPAYDALTHNLVWAIRARSDEGSVNEDGVNYDTRILGRGGVMSVKLIDSPEAFESTIPVVKGILTGFRFKPGQTYAEWRKGDRVAAFGLGALILGGGAAVAAKTGLLAKLGALILKTWKLVAVGFVAFFAWLKRTLFMSGSSTSK
jgi:uncharacterized membrane-anchored protein